MIVATLKSHCYNVFYPLQYSLLENQTRENLRDLRAAMNAIADRAGENYIFLIRSKAAIKKVRENYTTACIFCERVADDGF